MSEEITTGHFYLTESTRVISSRVETVYTSSECSSTLPNLHNAAQELSGSTPSSIRNPFEGEEYVLNAQSVQSRNEEQSVDSSNDGQSDQPRDQEQLVESRNEEHAAQSVQPVQPVQPREEQPASTGRESENTPATDLIVRSDVCPSLPIELICCLQLPAPLPGPPVMNELDEKHYDEDVEVGAAGATISKDPEKQEHQTPNSPYDKKKVGFFRRLYNKFRATYAPVVDPPLILPICPNDEEKYCYLRTNRIPLYILGIFAFLSLSTGMWLFTICSYIFAWFGFFVVLLQFYLIVSYFVGVVGTDYDFKGHQEILRNHAITPDNAPTVDIFLPCCMEPMEILENTYRHIQALDYPADKIQVHVMDDGNLDAVKELAARYGFLYRVRDDRPRLRKAGNLRWNFARTAGEFFAIFDADFCPRPDFLKEILPEHMADDKTAIVQTPQFFRVSDSQTWVEQGAGATQELFYRVVQVNRNKWGASICVGSNAVYRRESLEEVGGTAEIGFSEDVHTG